MFSLDENRPRWTNCKLQFFLLFINLLNEVIYFHPNSLSKYVAYRCVSKSVLMPVMSCASSTIVSTNLKFFDLCKKNWYFDFEVISNSTYLRKNVMICLFNYVLVNCSENSSEDFGFSKMSFTLQSS